jgi:hypothetical protein
MDNLATIEPSSTTLDPGAVTPTAAGGGSPNIPNEAPSLRDSIEAAVKEVSQPEAKEGEAAKPDKDADHEKGEAKPKEGAEKPQADKSEEKPKEQPKAPERAPDGKFSAKPEADGTEKGEGGNQPTQVKQGISQAPSRFLPDAKEKWANTPRAVQRDVENLIREREADVDRYRETSERYERVRDFDELARSNGRELRDSLAQVHQFENMMRQNPVAALNMALMEVGPRKNDGQPYSLFEIAQAVVQQGPEAYQRMMTQSAPAEQREDPRIAQLQQQLQQVKVQSLTEQVIEPFKAEHPRYEELQDHIAMFLQSGIIPKTLSLHDRLAAAYDMAERINPSSHVASQASNDPGPDPDTRRADADFSGSKSIKSAPGSVTPDEEPERGGSIREQLERAIRNQRRA